MQKGGYEWGKGYDTDKTNRCYLTMPDFKNRAELDAGKRRSTLKVGGEGSEDYV